MKVPVIVITVVALVELPVGVEKPVDGPSVEVVKSPERGKPVSVPGL